MSNDRSPHATRESAHAAGARHFFTGEACKRGHISNRFVANGGCVDCVNFRPAVIQGTNVRPLLRPLVFGMPDPPVGLLELAHLRLQRQLRSIEAEYLAHRAAGWTDEQLQKREADAQLAELKAVIP